MDSTTTSEEDRKNRIARGIVAILPVRVTEYIPLNFVVTENSAYFVDNLNKESEV